ncbi:hypothetical protein D3C72_1893990 [compost metagenome]
MLRPGKEQCRTTIAGARGAGTIALRTIFIDQRYATGPVVVRHTEVPIQAIDNYQVSLLPLCVDPIDHNIQAIDIPAYGIIQAVLLAVDTRNAGHFQRQASGGQQPGQATMTGCKAIQRQCQHNRQTDSREQQIAFDEQRHRE